MGRCIIILDALNQLEDRDNAPDLGWLPEYFPENIRVILSTLPGRCLDAVTKRGWNTMKVQPLEMDERKEFIKDYLAQYGQELSERRIVRITAERQSANPLYLKTLLDELRVFGVYEKLDEKIDYYLKAKTVDDLYELMLERLENDYERDCKGLVRKVTTLIWASRRGLSENEIKELLGARDNPLPHAYWSPLYLALEESLVNRSGLLTFFHDYLRKAVGDKYIRDTESEHAAHLLLADYFEKKEIDDRKADELPWQLQEAQAWERLKNCITNLDMFYKLITETKIVIDTKLYELTSYWLSLGERYDMVKSYMTSLQQYEKVSSKSVFLAYCYDRIAYLFMINARYEGIELLYRKAIAIYKEMLGKNDPHTAASLSHLAMLHHSKGDYADAEPLYRRSVAICEKVLGKDHPNTATVLSNLALLFEDKGDYDGAEHLCRRVLAIREKVLGKDHPDTVMSLNNLATLLSNKGNYSDVEPIYRRALAFHEKVLGKDHPRTAKSINNLAGLLYKMGDYAKAEPLFHKALEISEKVLGKNHPDTAISLNNLGSLLCSKGDYYGAEPLYHRALAIREKVLGKDHPDTATSLNSLAVLLYHKGEYRDAEPLYRRALAIFEKELGKDHPRTAESLNNIGTLLCSKGDHYGAEPLFHRALATREKVLGKNHPDTAISLNNLAELLCCKADCAGAEPLYRRALAIFEKELGKDHQNTAECLNGLAILLHSKGDHGGAEPLYRRVLAIKENVLGKDHPDTIQTLFNLAQLLDVKGDHGKASVLYKQIVSTDETVLKRIGTPKPLWINLMAVSYNALAFISCVPEKNWKEAEHYYQKAIELFSKVPDPLEAANSELNLQTMYHISGQQVDVERVKALTRILEEANDKRAEKGHKILKEISE